MFRGLSGTLPIGGSSDLRDSGINVVYLGGPWLGLPNRDYYLEEGNEEVRQSYIETNGKLLERLGQDADAAFAAARAIYDFEKSLAETTLTREEAQDPELPYIPATVDEIEQRYPQMNWRSYLEELASRGLNALSSPKPLIWISSIRSWQRRPWRRSATTCACSCSGASATILIWS